mgnify:CR=1 FL=1
MCHWMTLSLVMIALSALESATPLRSGILALGGEQEVSS